MPLSQIFLMQYHLHGLNLFLVLKILPKRMVLMMQKKRLKEFGQNLGKEYHALSIFISNAYQLTEKHAVSRKVLLSFQLSILCLSEWISSENLFLFSQIRVLIRKIFTQRRKQLGSLAKKEEPVIGKIIFAWLNSIKHPTLVKT